MVKGDSGKGNPVRRETVLIALFGALWGLMEITLGVTLKGLRIPLGGAVLTGTAAIIFLTGRYFVRRRGSILMMGFVAALVKIFSVGTVIAGPFLAILVEALLAEILISLLGVRRIGFILTAAILLLYTLVHPFLAQGILFGADIYKLYLEMFRQVARVLHVDFKYLGFLVLAYAGIHAVAGVLTGWVAWLLAIRVEQEFMTASAFQEETGWKKIRPRQKDLKTGPERHAPENWEVRPEQGVAKKVTR